MSHRDAHAQQVVTDDAVAAYQRDGAVCLRGLLSCDEVALLRAGIDHNLAAPSPRAIVASRAGDPGRFVEDFCNWQHNSAYRRVIFESPLAVAAARLMRSPIARLYHDHMLTKEPGTQQRTPWHQDQPYYNIDGRDNVSFWIAVDPVRRHSTLEFVAGSHRGPWLGCVDIHIAPREAPEQPQSRRNPQPGLDTRRGVATPSGAVLGPHPEGRGTQGHRAALRLLPGALPQAASRALPCALGHPGAGRSECQHTLMPRTFMDHQARWFPEGSLADLPDVEAQRGELPILGWAVEPGDVVGFHMLALHAAGPVDADRRRRVFSVRFLGDDIRHAPRPWKTSPPFEGLAEALPAGAAMEHPLFPLVWPRSP